MKKILVAAAISFFVRWCSGESLRAEKSRRLGNEGQIAARLLHGHDPFARPPVPDSSQHTTVIVIVSIYLNNVLWNHLSSQATVELFLRQQWTDERLKYDVEPREGIEAVKVPLNKRVWTPDTYFTMGSEGRAKAKRSTRVEPSGHVHFSQQKSLVLPVTYGRHFPFSNTRSITLRLSSYNYDIDDVVYTWADSPPLVLPIEVSPNLKEIYLSFSQFETKNLTECAGNFTVGQYACIEATVTFTGSVVEPLFRIFLPSIFLILVSWLHFWIHGSWTVPRTFSASAPFFIFVSILVFYPQPYLSLGNVGGLQIWFLFCVSLTFLSLVEYFCVICCGVRRNVYYQLSSNTEHPLSAAREAAEEAMDTRCSNLRRNDGLDLISRLLFPVIFIIFLFIYLLFYLI